MITLLTKDGRKTGNAIIYDTNSENNTVLIETDFGNKCELNLNEVAKLYHFGQKMDYDKWKQDRYERITVGYRVKDDDADCDECGNVIPNVPGGDFTNKYHKESCSLYDKDKP